MGERTVFTVLHKMKNNLKNFSYRTYCALGEWSDWSITALERLAGSRTASTISASLGGAA